MNVGLHTFVDLYSNALASLSGLLAKGAAFAAEKGVSEEEMLGWRLAEDMFPLRRQAQVVISFSRQWPARAAGRPAPASLEGETSVAEFQAAITEAQAELAGLSAADFEGKGETPFTMKLGDAMEPTLPIGQWLTNFATTNIYFHLSIAYAILRVKGVPLSKPDMFGGGL